MNREQAQLEAALAQGLQADDTPDLLGSALRRMADIVESGRV